MKYTGPTEYAPLGYINNFAIDLMLIGIVVILFSIPVIYLLAKYILVPVLGFIFEGVKVLVGFAIILGIVVLLDDIFSTKKCETPNMTDEGICYGTYTWDVGDKYVGKWKDGKINGEGTYTWASGRKYVGKWKDGDFSGQGTLTYPDGKIKSGEWENNVLIKPDEIKNTKSNEPSFLSKFYNFSMNKWNERKQRKNLEKWVKNNRSKNSSTNYLNANEGAMEINLNSMFGDKIIECPQGKSAECFDDSGTLYEFMDDDNLMDMSTGQLIIVDD